MDTAISVEVVVGETGLDPSEAIGQCFAWFAEVERRCSRFDPESELMQLCATASTPVKVSHLLFSAIDFALTVAAATKGAFDPTIGVLMEERGFDRNYQSGRRLRHRVPGAATYRDVDANLANETGCLRRPLVLDLGAVAKGLAIDLAAASLRACPGFAIDAGGDIFAAGLSPSGGPWRIGIHHPRNPGTVMETIEISGEAVCTSGDYERAPGRGHHLVDARTASTAQGAASVTVVAPRAMLADSLSTAVFALGPKEGLELLENEGVEGLVVTADVRRHETSGFARYRR